MKIIIPERHASFIRLLAERYGCTPAELVYTAVGQHCCVDEVDPGR